MLSDAESRVRFPQCVSIWCLSPSGKASDCDSDMRGFDPHQTPQRILCLVSSVVEQCFYTAKVGSSKLSRGTNNARIAQSVEQ